MKTKEKTSLSGSIYFNDVFGYERLNIVCECLFTNLDVYGECVMLFSSSADVNYRSSNRL